MRLNCFSNSFCVNSMATGLPWGQYFTWPDMTARATRSSSWSLVFQPPLMAALQAMVCSSSSRAAAGSASPVVCRLPAQEQEALLSHRPLLEEFGFDVDELGSGLAVRQAPFDVAVEDIESTLSELGQKLLSTGNADPAAARDELLHTMACKAAIKGGWKTSPRELERVAQAVMSGQVKYCPHGRPVAIELTRQQLEKQFKRS